MLDLPPRVFLEPVVVTAGRIARAQAGPAAGLERRVVLKIALGGRTPAGRAGAGGVPDLGQVPQPGPGVVAGGLEPVVAVLGGDRVDDDQQVRLPWDAGGQPPGPVAAGRAVLI